MHAGLYAPHLPPSAGPARVLALDAPAAAELAPLAQVSLAREAGAASESAFDAVAGQAPPARVPALLALLRPGGRLILTTPGEAHALLAALEQAGCIHCLVEPAGAGQAGLMLYRGERPPRGGSLERHRQLAGAAGAPAELLEAARRAGNDLVARQDLRYLFLLITQRPNKPAWKLEPGETLAWEAATLRLPGDEQPRLLVFGSLARAVAFMQPAVLAGLMQGVNKVGKFGRQAAHAWPLPMLFNLPFEAAQGARPGPPLAVDPAQAIRGE